VHASRQLNAEKCDAHLIHDRTTRSSSSYWTLRLFWHRSDAWLLLAHPVMLREVHTPTMKSFQAAYTQRQELCRFRPRGSSFSAEG
jgi:hypothetical protein